MGANDLRLTTIDRPLSSCVRRFLGLDHDPGYDEITGLLQHWEPYTGMIYFHLLLDGLAERGDLDV